MTEGPIVYKDQKEDRGTYEEELEETTKRRRGLGELQSYRVLS